MFSQLRLATKLALGFGVLVLLTGILGTVGWHGLTELQYKSNTLALGNDSMQALQDCAALRRDFELNGFAKNAAGVSADTAWAQRCDALETALTQLSRLDGLGREAADTVAAAQSEMPKYKAAFADMARYRRTIDDVIAQWAAIGNQVTTDLDRTNRETINPLLDRAVAGKDAGELERWSTVALKLQHEINQRFLLVRVRANVLLRTRDDVSWETLANERTGLVAGIKAWTDLTRDLPQLQGVAAKFAAHETAYWKEAEKCREAMLGARETAERMAAAAAGVVRSIKTLREVVDRDAKAEMSETLSLSLSVSLGSVVIGILLAIFMTRGITGPIRQVIAGLDAGSSQVSDASGRTCPKVEWRAGNCPGTDNHRRTRKRP